MVRYWLSMTVGGDVFINYGLGHAVGRIMGVLYTEDGAIGSLYPEWLQGSLNLHIGLFRCIGLMSNLAKSKNMTFQPGTILSVMSEGGVGWISMGKVDTYRERLCRRLPCLYCRL